MKEGFLSRTLEKIGIRKKNIVPDSPVYSPMPQKISFDELWEEERKKTRMTGPDPLINGNIRDSKEYQERVELAQSKAPEVKINKLVQGDVYNSLRELATLTDNALHDSSRNPAQYLLSDHDQIPFPLQTVYSTDPGQETTVFYREPRGPLENGTIQIVNPEQFHAFPDSKKVQMFAFISYMAASYINPPNYTQEYRNQTILGAQQYQRWVTGEQIVAEHKRQAQEQMIAKYRTPMPDPIFSIGSIDPELAEILFTDNTSVQRTQQPTQHPVSNEAWQTSPIVWDEPAVVSDPRPVIRDGTTGKLILPPADKYELEVSKGQQQLHVQPELTLPTDTSEEWFPDVMSAPVVTPDDIANAPLWLQEIVQPVQITVANGPEVEEETSDEEDLPDWLREMAPKPDEKKPADLPKSDDFPHIRKDLNDNRRYISTGTLNPAQNSNVFRMGELVNQVIQENPIDPPTDQEWDYAVQTYLGQYTNKTERDTVENILRQVQTGFRYTWEANRLMSPYQIIDMIYRQILDDYKATREHTH